jgi:hypothetical protein
VFFERERMPASLTIHGSSRSTSTRSAGAPGFSVPPGSPNSLAGAVESASISLISGISSL